MKYHESISKLATLNAPIDRRDEATFGGLIISAKQEMEEFKSNQTIDQCHKRNLINRIDRELQRLSEEHIHLILSHLPLEIRASINAQCPTTVEQCRDIVKCCELITELAKMKAPICKRDEATFGD